VLQITQAGTRVVVLENRPKPIAQLVHAPSALLRKPDSVAVAASVQNHLIALDLRRKPGRPEAKTLAQKPKANFVAVPFQELAAAVLLDAKDRLPKAFITEDTDQVCAKNRSQSALGMRFTQ